MITTVLHEPKAVYAALEDTETLKRGPVFFEKEGKPTAVLLSIEDYEQLTNERKSGGWRREQLRRTQADHEAFERLLPELLKEHRDEWVAIHRGHVIGFGREFGDLIRQMRNNGYRDFYVQKVQESLRAIQLPLEVIRA